MLLDVKDLEVAYGDYQVVWGVSLSVAAGESVVIDGVDKLQQGTKVSMRLVGDTRKGPRG